MKTLSATLIISLFLSINLIFAQDTLFVYKAGQVVIKKAVNDLDSLSFTYTPPSSGIVKDIDGNTYHWIKIGTQTWMVENLKTTKFRTGESISNITDAAAWSGSTFASWCNYNNDGANGVKYGHLYNWYAVNDIRKIAPVGWHIPSDSEWSTFISYLTTNSGFSLNVPKALAATYDWPINTIDKNSIGYNLTINNFSGFNALPAGYTYNFSTTTFSSFQGLLQDAFWWSSNQSIYTSYGINLSVGNCWHLTGLDFKQEFKPFECGSSVRCIKD